LSSGCERRSRSRSAGGIPRMNLTRALL
jgi:hypothetical protein